MRPFKIKKTLAPFAPIATLALLFSLILPSCGGGDTTGAPASLPASITTGRIVGYITEVVTIENGAGRIAGRASAAQNSNSLQGFIVTIPATGQVTTTDAQGYFSFSFVPAGKNTKIEVYDPTGTRIAKVLVHVDIRQTSTSTLNVASTLQALLAEVLVEQLQTLVAGYAGLSQYEVLSQITDEQLAALLLAADVNSDGVITVDDFDSNGDGVVSTAEITAAAQTTAFNNVLSDMVGDAGPNIQGTVTDKNTGAAIADAVVKIYADNYVNITLTDAAGLYALYSVPAGSYFLIATKGGYTLETKIVVVQ